MSAYRSLYGRFLGVDERGQIVAPGGFGTSDGAPGAVMGDNYVGFFDDFLGDAIADQWAVTEGSDSGTTDAAIVGVPNGKVRLTAGDSAGSVAADGIQLDRGVLGWKANMGQLSFRASVALGVITNMSCFLGFTDQIAALEAPIIAAGTLNTLTTNASDAVGFMFDTSMTNDNWWLVGVKGNTDAVHQDTGFAPVADTFEKFAISLDASGNALFWRNGVVVGTKMADALTATVALSPVFMLWPRTAAAGKYLDIDYCGVQALRV